MSNVEKPKSWPYFGRESEIEASQCDSRLPSLALDNPTGLKRYGTYDVSRLPEPFFEECLLKERCVDFSSLRQQFNQYELSKQDIKPDEVKTVEALLKAEEGLILLNDALVEAMELALKHIDDRKCASCAKSLDRELKSRQQLFVAVVENEVTFILYRRLLEFLATYHDKTSDPNQIQTNRIWYIEKDLFDDSDDQTA